jgi:hypothetical protein
MRFLLFSLRQTKQLSDITRGKMHNSESPESRLVHYQTLICAQNKLRCHAESAQISARLRQLGEERMAFICASAKELCPKCVDLRS